MHIALRILNQMAPAYLQILQTITLFLALLQIPFKMHVLAEWKSRLATDICYAQIAGIWKTFGLGANEVSVWFHMQRCVCHSPLLFVVLELC